MPLRVRNTTAPLKILKNSKLKLKVSAGRQYFGDVIQAEGDPFSFLAGRVRSEDEQPVSDMVSDHRRGQPSAQINFLFARVKELAGHQNMSRSICASVLLQQPRALWIELNLQGVASVVVDHFGFLHAGLR